jgi:D-alanine--poly(phosphoribitol) ligase subunit 1
MNREPGEVPGVPRIPGWRGDDVPPARQASRPLYRRGQFPAYATHSFSGIIGSYRSDGSRGGVSPPFFYAFRRLAGMNSSCYGRTISVSTTIHEAFDQVARSRPDHPAIRSAGRTVTYAELAAAADNVAAALAERGVGPGHIVPVVTRRSADLPAILLGILATGAAYGMLDVRWPPGRLQHFVRQMAAPLAVVETGEGTRALPVPAVATAALVAGSAPASPRVDVSPQDCAMVFWTSGSTGSPKAVLSPHQATTRLFSGAGFLDYGSAPVMIHAAAVAWDAFTLELWGMLLLGGTLLVHADDVLLPGSLMSYIRDYGATHLFLTPSLADVLVGGDIGCLAGLKCLMLGGDRPNPATCQRILATYPDMELLNCYGPVESCVFSTTHRITPAGIDAGSDIPAGTAVPGTGVHIVRDGRVLPRGEHGEIALSGDGLGLGYLNEPELTSASFRTVLVDDMLLRVYMTGDYGSVDNDGVLHISGRKDAQVKIAGHRIEPAEVEAAALSLGCSRAVALPVRDKAGDPRIVLFAEPEPSFPELTEQGLKTSLRKILPGYMMPACTHLVPAIPLLDNTKIDKRALAESFGYARPQPERNSPAL